MKKHKPGTCPDGRIAVKDANGNIRGHVGPHAVAGTVMRFGVRNPQLKKINGKLEWHGDTAAPRRRPPETANHKSARGSVRAPGT